MPSTICFITVQPCIFCGWKLGLNQIYWIRSVFLFRQICTTRFIGVEITKLGSKILPDSPISCNSSFKIHCISSWVITFGAYAILETIWCSREGSYSVDKVSMLNHSRVNSLNVHKRNCPLLNTAVSLSLELNITANLWLWLAYTGCQTDMQLVQLTNAH